MTDRADGRGLRRWAMVGLALALVATAYSNVLAGPFVWDDRPLILDQPGVHRIDHPARFLTDAFWTRSPNDEANDAYYRPLVTLSYAANWAATGPVPAAFHATNLILHLIVCALIFAVALRFGAAPAAAAAAAGLVGVLPRLTECVTWVSGRTDVLAAVFALGALALHGAGRGALLRRCGAALLLLLGLLSKEVAIAAAAGILIIELRDASAAPGRARRIVFDLVPAVVAVSLYVVLRSGALAGIRPKVGSAPLTTALSTATQALGAYLVMILDPLRPRLQIGLAGGFAPGYLGAGIVALLLIAWMSVRAVRARWPLGVCVGISVALSSLVLVLHLVPIRVNTLTADRFLYFPAIGLGLALAVAAGRLGRGPRRLAWAAVIVAAPVLAHATFTRNEDWADELRLWRAAVATSPPENVLPRAELGNALFRRGMFDEARAEWEAALPFADPVLRPYVVGNLASAYSELGRYEEARALTTTLVAREPDLPLHRYNLGVIEARALELDAAERELERALDLLPDYTSAAKALAIVRQAREESRRLSPETEGERLPVQVARAHLDERLGRRLEAERRWIRVLESDQLSDEQAWQAARFLLGKGTADGARRALAPLEARGLASAAQLEELREDRARREAEGLFADGPEPARR